MNNNPNNQNNNNVPPAPGYPGGPNPGQPPFANQPGMPNSAQQPQQIVPGYGGPQQPTPRPVVPKKPMNPKTKKMIILICSIGGGVLILGIAALIILPIIFKVDYKATYEVAESVNDARREVQNSDSCGGVINYVDSDYQSSNDFGKYVSDCKSNLEEFKKGVEQLAATSGVQRDAEIKKEWEEFKASYDRSISAYTQLIDIYSDWHTVLADWHDTTGKDDWWTTMNESKVKSLTSALTESSNATLKTYGEGYVAARWKQISAYQAYQKAYDAYFDAAYNAPNKNSLRDDMNAKREIYNGANQDLDDFNTNEPDINDTESLVGLDLDKPDNQFFTKFSSVYSEISAKYLEQGIKDAFNL